jgi:signal transduction histidine kinase
MKVDQCLAAPQFTWRRNVTECTNLQNAVTLEMPVPDGASSLESILLTEELLNRPWRPPDHETENSALVALTRALADSPRTILQTLSEKVLDILHVDSAGLSLVTKDKNSFHWPAIAGAWRPHIGGGTPRHFGPCGDVLDSNSPMLFTHWERRYPYLSKATPLAEEGLLIPFYVNGTAVGTIWAIAHDKCRKFDGEDLRLLESMSRFASAAYQAVESNESLRLEIDARKKAETGLRELTNGLETQVQIRTAELAAVNEELKKEIRERRLVEEKLRQGEMELRRSEAFLAEGEAISGTGSFLWRVATDDITWSAQTYRIFETEQSIPVTLELIGTRVHPEDVQSFYGLVDRMRNDGSDFEHEHRLQMPDRSVKHLRMVAHGARDRDGKLEYIGAIQDVTESKLSEEVLGKVRSELAHVARVASLGVLTASIAHEVNQPLSGIITNASTCLRMLAADPPNIEGARETTLRSIRDGNRASDVIARLRALFGKKDTTTDLVDLNKAAREVIALSLSELQRGRVVLHTEFGDDLPLVTGDRIQLQQVILNMIRNASDAMNGITDRPRQLTVVTERDGYDRVRLIVKDAGIGFESQGTERLFEAFYTTKNEGMGIGLSVSRSIIEHHHGRLWATPNDGPGATFAFSIPHGLCSSDGAGHAADISAIDRPAHSQCAEGFAASVSSVASVAY